MGMELAPSSSFLVSKLFGACKFKEFELGKGMSFEILETTSDVIEALGGNQPVAELTASKPNAVSNWRTFPTFPSNTYVAMTGALHAIGKTAPPSLWSMRVPVQEIASCS